MKKSLLDYTLKIRVPLIVFVAVLAFVATYYFPGPSGTGGICPGPAGGILAQAPCRDDADRLQILPYLRHGLAPCGHPAGRHLHELPYGGAENRPEIIKLTKYYEDGWRFPGNGCTGYRITRTSTTASM